MAAVAFSSDGSMFVTVGMRHVKFWYLESSRSKVRTKPQAPNNITANPQSASGMEISLNLYSSYMPICVCKFKNFHWKQSKKVSALRGYVGRPMRLKSKDCFSPFSSH